MYWKKPLLLDKNTRELVFIVDGKPSISSRPFPRREQVRRKERRNCSAFSIEMASHP